MPQCRQRSPSHWQKLLYNCERFDRMRNPAQWRTENPRQTSQIGKRLGKKHHSSTISSTSLHGGRTNSLRSFSICRRYRYLFQNVMDVDLEKAHSIRALGGGFLFVDGEI